MIARNPDYKSDPEELRPDDTTGHRFSAGYPHVSEDPLAAYLSQIGSYPLLTRQQEIDLAKEIEFSRRRAIKRNCHTNMPRTICFTTVSMICSTRD